MLGLKAGCYNNTGCQQCSAPHEMFVTEIRSVRRPHRRVWTDQREPVTEQPPDDGHSLTFHPGDVWGVALCAFAVQLNFVHIRSKQQKVFRISRRRPQSQKPDVRVLPTGAVCTVTRTAREGC